MSVTRTEVWAYECPLCYAEYKPGSEPDDGRCGQCDADPKLREKQSEFGAGIVVCLAKFSEHLGDRHYQRIWDYRRWLTARKREGKNPGEWEEGAFYRYPALRGAATTPEEYAMHEAIHRWAGGAGDHFFELDTERAPEPLRELADLVLELRNSHLADQQRLFTVEDVKRVRRLWEESCIALDRMLGTVPNWGEN